MKTNLMHCSSSVYFVIHPLHVSGMFVAHHEEVYCIYTIGTCCAFYLTVCWPNRQSTKKRNTYQLLYIYSIPPDDGLQTCPKHEEVEWRNKPRINRESSWFSLHGPHLKVSEVNVCTDEQYLRPVLLMYALRLKIHANNPLRKSSNYFHFNHRTLFNSNR